MCTSETTICYGVVIRSWQLIVAAHAFVKFSPLLRGIDTVIFRQRNGTLRVKKRVQATKNMSDMPLEVLEMIRKEISEERELRMMANRTLCYMAESSDWKRIPVPHGRWGGCECWEDLSEALEGVDLYSCNSQLVGIPSLCRRHPLTQRNVQKDLLNYYGLVLPSRTFIDTTSFESGWMIQNSSNSIIALPSSIKSFSLETDQDGASRANGIVLNSILEGKNFKEEGLWKFGRLFADWGFDFVPALDSPVKKEKQTKEEKDEKDAQGAKKSASAVDSEHEQVVPVSGGGGWVVFTKNEAC